MSRKNGLPSAALERVQQSVAPGGRVVRVRPMRGGVSSSVHLVHLEGADGRRQAVVVRRYGEYWLKVDPTACAREYRVLELLSQRAFPSPRPLLLEAEGGPFGAPTVVMSRLPGRPLLAPRDLPEYFEQMARMLARLHAMPLGTDFDFLPEQPALVNRTLSAEAPRGDPLQEEVWHAVHAEWARVADRVGQRRALLHGDFWPGNLLWVRGRLVGVIDWEQPRLGDPTKDVATSRGDVSILFGVDAADAFVRTYERVSGTQVRELRFWDLLVCTWAVREIADWATVYPLLGRPDVSVDLARERIRAFARAALDRSAES